MTIDLTKPNLKTSTGSDSLSWKSLACQAFLYAVICPVLSLILISLSILPDFYPVDILIEHGLGLGWLCFALALASAALNGRLEILNWASLFLFTVSISVLTLIIIYKHYEGRQWPLVRFWLAATLITILFYLVLKRKPTASPYALYGLSLPLSLGCFVWPLAGPVAPGYVLGLLTALVLPLGPAVCLGRLRAELRSSNPAYPSLAGPPPPWAPSYLASRLPVFWLFSSLGNSLLYPLMIFSQATSPNAEDSRRMPLFFIGCWSELIKKDCFPDGPEDLSGVRSNGGVG